MSAGGLVLQLDLLCVPPSCLGQISNFPSRIRYRGPLNNAVYPSFFPASNTSLGDVSSGRPLCRIRQPRRLYFQLTDKNSLLTRNSFPRSAFHLVSFPLTKEMFAGISTLLFLEQHGEHLKLRAVAVSIQKGVCDPA